MSDDVSLENQQDLNESGFEGMLNYLEERTEDFVLSLIPLGDSCGWRAEFRISSAELVVAKASSTQSPLTAACQALERGIAWLEEATSETEDEEADLAD